MAYSNIFSENATSEMLARLENLTADTKPEWGKMNAGQMLAHLNVAYDMLYKDFKKPGAITKFFLKLFVKKPVVNSQPYKKNGGTAPQFVIKEEKDFEKEKAELIANVERTAKHGATYFEGKENISFGELSSEEWSNLFGKHMDHHFTQFGV